MAKMLKDWTLNELKEYCATHVRECPSGRCPFRAVCNVIVNGYSDAPVPGDWDLTDAPRFGEQDKADAGALLRVFPWAVKIIRFGHELQARALPEDGRIVDISQEMFPSVKVGQTATLNEILTEGGANA